MMVPFKAVRVFVFLFLLVLTSATGFADTCSTRHFYNNSPFTWKFSIVNGTCSYYEPNGTHHEKMKNCTISPFDGVHRDWSVAEIYYNNDMAEAIHVDGPDPFKSFFGANNRDLRTMNFPDPCTIEHNGPSPFMNLNEPATGDITTCPYLCGFSMMAPPDQGPDVVCASRGMAPDAFHNTSVETACSVRSFSSARKGFDLRFIMFRPYNFGVDTLDGGGVAISDMSGPPNNCVSTTKKGLKVICNVGDPTTQLVLTQGGKNAVLHFDFNSQSGKDQTIASPYRIFFTTQPKPGWPRLPGILYLSVYPTSGPLPAPVFGVTLPSGPSNLVAAPAQ